MGAVMGRTLDKGVLIGLGSVVALLVVIPVLTYWNTNTVERGRPLGRPHAGSPGTYRRCAPDAGRRRDGAAGLHHHRKDDFLQPYNAALVRLDERLAKLRDETKDNPRQQANIGKLAAMTTKCLVLLKRVSPCGGRASRRRRRSSRPKKARSRWMPFGNWSMR